MNDKQIKSNGKTQVEKFWLQPTISFPDGAPQREEYILDCGYEEDCIIYAKEWVDTYECMNTNCKNRDCPQHFGIKTELTSKKL